MADRPRLSIFKSNKGLYAQIIDDQKGKTIVGISSAKLAKKEKLTRTTQAEALGKEIALLAKKAKVVKVVFDRGSYKYHGIVKAFADGARKGGLIF